MGILKGKRDGQAVAFRLDREATVLGSAQDCQIRVPDAAPRHCQIIRMANGFVLRDLSGATGTFVNGKRVKEHLLSERDVVQLGTERFTFSNEAGQATARVAVPASAAQPANRQPTARMPAAAPQPANRPVTSRVPAAPPAAAPAKSGNTGRIPASTTRAIPAAAPAAQPAQTGRTTSRIPAQAPANGRATQGIKPATQSMRPATQRMGAATTRRMPARTTGRIKKTGGFSMPTTAKGKMVAGCVAVGIIALIGGLVFFLSQKVDPKEQGELCKKDVDELRKLETDPAKAAEALRKAQEIDGNRYYRDFGTENWRYVHKNMLAGTYQQAAKDFDAAEKEVRPFLAKYNQAKAGDPDKFEEQIQNLQNEAKAIYDKWARSQYGSQLKEIADYLLKRLSEPKDSWIVKFASELQPEVHKLVMAGNVKGAFEEIKKFGEKFRADKDAELSKKIGEITEKVKRESKGEFVGKVVHRKIQEMKDDGKKKEEILKYLEGLPGPLEGADEAIKELDALIAKTKAEK